jgi:hypothetical protein
MLWAAADQVPAAPEKANAHSKSLAERGRLILMFLV